MIEYYIVEFALGFVAVCIVGRAIITGWGRDTYDAFCDMRSKADPQNQSQFTGAVTYRREGGQNDD